MQVGLYGSSLLGDLDVEVIHVEEKGRGDPLREITFSVFRIEFTKTPMTLRTSALEVREHTEQIHLDILGYTWENIQNLKDSEEI